MFSVDTGLDPQADRIASHAVSIHPQLTGLGHPRAQPGPALAHPLDPAAPRNQHLQLDQHVDGGRLVQERLQGRARRTAHIRRVCRADYEGSQGGV